MQEVKGGQYPSYYFGYNSNILEVWLTAVLKMI